MSGNSKQSACRAIKVTVLLSLAAISAGCVTNLIDTFDPAKIAERKTPFKAYAGPERAAGQVVALRTWFERNERGNMNSTITYNQVLSIDGIDVSKTKSNFAHVLPGRHSIRLNCDPGPKHRIQDTYKSKVAELSVDFQLGKTYWPEGELRRLYYGGPGVCEPAIMYVDGDESRVPRGW